MLLLYLIGLILLLIVSLSYKEGFESGTYAYLAPHDPAILDSTTQSNFITTFNNSGAVVVKELILSDTNRNLNDLKTIVTLDEINYYIQNKKWPYNSYIMNYVVSNKDAVLKQLSGIKSLEDLQKVFPTRFIYMLFINPTESKLSPPPLSNNIYMGKAVAPPEAPVVKDETPVATIHPPFSSENYTKLQSICSTLR
jgi:hypothetical protein